MTNTTGIIRAIAKHIPKYLRFHPIFAPILLVFSVDSALKAQQTNEIASYALYVVAIILALYSMFLLLLIYFPQGDRD